MKYLILCLLLAGCGEKKNNTKYVIDMDQSFVMYNGDSVWRPNGRFINDTMYPEKISYGHWVYVDTSFVIKNWKPIAVIIYDNKDTVRYWNGDTIHLSTCHPGSSIYKFKNKIF